MTVISFASIAATVADVTSEQIGKCHAVFVGSKKFYMVESSDGTKEYRVWRNSTGYHCQCESGKHGFWNVKHPSGVCKHVRWAIACHLEEKRAMAEQERLNAAKAAANVSYTDVDAETLERIAARNAKPRPITVLPPTRRAGFSLLK